MISLRKPSRKINEKRPYRNYWDVVMRDYLPTEKLSEKLDQQGKHCH